MDNDILISLLDEAENVISPLKFHHLPRGVIGCY